MQRQALSLLLQADAEEAFIRVSTAYETLADEVCREGEGGGRGGT